MPEPLPHWMPRPIRRGFASFSLFTIVGCPAEPFRVRMNRLSARMRWQQIPSWRGRLILVAQGFAWPITAGLSAWAAAHHYASSVRSETGLSTLRQFQQQYWCALRALIPPPNYYLFGMYRPEMRRRGGEYIHEYEMALITNHLNRSLDRKLVNDKSAFTRHCHDCGLPVAPILTTFENGEAHDIMEFRPGTYTDGFFAKPRDLSGGEGAMAWDPIPDQPERYRAKDGPAVGMDDIRAQLSERSRTHAYLLQPRLVNDPSYRQWTSGGLCTVRVLTSMSKDGDPVVRLAALKMPTGGQIVDNFAGGGLVAPVEIATGILSEGAQKDASRPRQRVHPDTGAPVAGAQVPRWDEIRELAVRAHRTLPAYRLIGWDIAMTTHGAVLIEANLRPCFDLLQRAHDRPLGREIFDDITREIMNDLSA